MAVVAASRASLSMALLCIVDSNRTSNCHVNIPFWYLLSETLQEPLSLPWTVQQQAAVHSAFYAGALIAVFSANSAIFRFGAKNVITGALTATAFGAFSMPPVVILFKNWIILGFLRAVMGFGYGRELCQSQRKIQFRIPGACCFSAHQQMVPTE